MLKEVVLAKDISYIDPISGQRVLFYSGSRVYVDEIESVAWIGYDVTDIKEDEYMTEREYYASPGNEDDPNDCEINPDCRNRFNCLCVPGKGSR